MEFVSAIITGRFIEVLIFLILKDAAAPTSRARIQIQFYVAGRRVKVVSPYAGLLHR
jgi:hypothetical protein